MIWKKDDLPERVKHYVLKHGLIGEESQLKMTPYRRLTKTIPPDYRSGAVLLMLYEKDNEWFFPLTQRKEYDGVHSKQMSFPGGKIEKIDLDNANAAWRETEEEIGVNRKEILYYGDLSSLYIPPSNFMVYPFIGLHAGEPLFIKEEAEVDEIVEVPVRELLDDSLVKETLVEVKGGMKLKTPYFHLQNKVVWGATAAILSEFKDILKKLP